MVSFLYPYGYILLQQKERLMLTDLKACYSPQDLVFIVALFALTMMSVGAFLVLTAHAIRGALDEVKILKSKNES